MLISSIPTKIVLPFANGAGAGFIRPVPVPSQIGIQGGAASFTDGFPPDTFLPIGAGGVPPWGEDVNGILNQITAWARWVQAGAPIAYDAAFQAAVGGYPLGALIPSATSAGQYWLSTVDGNTTNPDTGGAGWASVALLGGTMSTGDWKWRPTQETLAGWIKANGTTLGNTGSGASQLADPAAANLFAWHWNNFSNSQCPVSTGRGANAAADFAALKTITVLNMRGIIPIGMDTMGGAPSTVLTGVPATSGSATQAGSILGEIFHVLLTAELAAHGHPITDPTHSHPLVDPGHAHGAPTPSAFVSLNPAFTATNPQYINNAGTTTTNSTGITISANSTGITVNSVGSSAGHNNVPLVMTGTHYLKL
jgi:hypothetical protein